MPAEVDTERVAMSAGLGELASRFAIESTLWKDGEARINLERTSRHLGQLSLAAIRDLNIDVGYAYASAATMLVREVESTRRFLMALDHRPIVPTMHVGKPDGQIDQLPNGRLRVTCYRCSELVGSDRIIRVGFKDRDSAVRAMEIHRSKRHRKGVEQ